MQAIMEFIKDTVSYVLASLWHNFPSLVLGILVASVISVFVNPDKVKDWLMKRSAVSIPASVAAGAFTPFCACGTMAVVIAMLATALPWGPIMAFLTSSPLMSPDEFILISGVISPSFAVALTLASIILGLVSGWLTHIIEKKTHYLDNQIRFAKTPLCDCSSAAETKSCCSSSTTETKSCCSSSATETASCGCSSTAVVSQNKTFIHKLRLKELARAAFDIGVKKILVFFVLFSVLGYAINRFVPTSIITALFGADRFYAVPLAAIIGLPLYVTGPSSIPIIQSLMQSGASGGAMLAFMITGPGTSAGVIAGIATIMKRKALALYVGYILAAGIILGYAYDLILKLF